MSGKTRALEVSENLVCDPLMGFSMSAAVTVRLVAERRRTVLFDEIDAVYGTMKRQDANGELVAFMNAGYRRGAKSHRCATGNGSKHEAIVFEAFAPLAVAGLRNLPDALATRAIIIRMRRRAPDEQVEPYRIKFHVAEAKPIREALEEWCAEKSASIAAEPILPDGVVDRAADIWEPLIVIADAAGTDWPDRARAAAIHFTRTNAEDESRSQGVELLVHIFEAFAGADKLWRDTLIERLIARDESPWASMHGKPLDGRGLAMRLKPYGLKSKTVRVGDRTAKGYDTADFADAWGRYLPPERHKRHKCHNIDNENNIVTDVTDVTLPPPRGDADDGKDEGSKMLGRDRGPTEGNGLANSGQRLAGHPGGGIQVGLLPDENEPLADDTRSANGGGELVQEGLLDNDPFASLKDESLIPDLPAFLDRGARV